MKTILAITVFLLAGCVFDTAGLNSGNDVKKTGLAVTLPAPAGSSVAGFIINVYGPGVASCDPMPTSPQAAMELVSLSTMNLPQGNTIPEVGHHFASKFLVLGAGSYCVKATPVDSSGVRVSACSLAQGGPYQVASSQTSEVMLVSNCNRPDNGGLNPVVVLNNDPLIKGLLFDRGNTIGTCETLHITATAEDPEHDALTFGWQVTAIPGGATDFEASFVANVFTFRSFVAGDYTVSVQACDSFQLCALLNFQIHVSGDACSPLPPPAPDSGIGGSEQEHG